MSDVPHSTQAGSTMGVAFIVGSFNRPDRLRTCLASLADQTYRDIEVIVVDNSDVRREAHAVRRRVEALHDSRFRYEYVGDRTFNKELNMRSLYEATEIGVSLTSKPWLCLPNCDSYYTPWFAERMLREATAQSLEMVYCDLIAGSANGHWPMQVSPMRCCCDKTCFLVRREWFKGFTHGPQAYPMADGILLEDLVARGIRHGRLGQTLVVHN